MMGLRMYKEYLYLIKYKKILVEIDNITAIELAGFTPKKQERISQQQKDALALWNALL